MASSTRSSTSSSFSRPYPPIMAKRQPALASVTRVTASASPPGMKTARRTPLMVALSGSLSQQQSRPDASTAAARKRSRKDSGVDENLLENRSPPRARQRLSSMSSTETLRAVVQVASQIIAQCQAKPTPSRKSSTSSMRRVPSDTENAPSTNSKHNRSHVSPDRGARVLRRVSNIEFPKMAEPKEDKDETAIPDVSRRYPSRIPLPQARNSSMARHARKVDEARSHYVISPPYLRPSSPYDEDLFRNSASDENTIEADKSKGRFELKIGTKRKHVELWDLPDDHVFAWTGYLTFIDHKYSEGDDWVPLHQLDIRCTTHSYEGRFSLESNDLPVYETRFGGEDVNTTEIAQLKREFDYEWGIVLQTDSWRAVASRPGHYQVRFFVPIPIALYRDRDTRMFKLEAIGRALDDRVFKDVVVTSNTYFDDISHLRKEVIMDRRPMRRRAKI